MKVFIHYEDTESDDLHKTSKVTLPKKWLDGPVTSILKLFVDTYNKQFEGNQLSLAEVHLENDAGEALANECVVSKYLSSSVDVYVKHGAPPALESVTAKSASGGGNPPPAPATKAKAPPAATTAGGLILCKRFGCQKKFDPAHNHEEACSYHRLPPVFHETVKFWACCPDKKTYSWDSFMEVKGCCTGAHTNEKPDQPSVLGGCDVRNGNDGSEVAAVRLKSIDEFNAERKAGGGGGGTAGESIAQMYQLRQAMDKAGVPGALFDAAKEKAAARLGGDHTAVAQEMATRLSGCLEAMRDE